MGWFCYGFAMVLICLCYGFVMVLLWFRYGFATVSVMASGIVSGMVMQWFRCVVAMFCQ